MSDAGARRAEQISRVAEWPARSTERIAQSATVYRISHIRETAGHFRQTGEAVRGLSTDEFRAALHLLAKNAPDALQAIVNALSGTMRAAKVSEQQQSRARPYSVKFETRLARLEETGIGLELVGHALQLWHRFCAAAVPPEPIVELTADGGLRFAWSTARSYLDAEIYSDGTTEWFFKDHETGAADGTADEREPHLPERFFRYLHAVE
jgi:hypothetical protein